jgi:uncharacterized protein (UPF0332 family)
MNSADREEYVQYRLSKADEALVSAQILCDNKQWNAAINRLYYAAYYAVSALLVRSALIAKSHSGVKTQFFLNFVKPGIIELRLGMVYTDLFDWRQKGDYGDFFDFTERDVHSIHGPTKELVESIKLLMKSKPID